MGEAKGAHLVVRDALERVPEEEGADEDARDGLEQIAAVGGRRHADTAQNWKRRGSAELKY